METQDPKVQKEIKAYDYSNDSDIGYDEDWSNSETAKNELSDFEKL